MKNFLVTHKAAIGRDISIENQHPTVTLTFYTLHQAEDREAVESQLIQYSDPTFKTRISSVSELGDTLSIEDLTPLLTQTTVFSE